MSSRILIADDAPVVRNVLKWVLESHSDHWEICGEAINGIQAVEKAIEIRPELIILDLQMPLMDGLSASAQISKLLPDVPILMFTLHKSPHVEHEARQVGVREVVSKSDAAALIKAVEKLLGRNPNSEAPTAIWPVD